MKKILSILPDSIAGTLIIKGFDVGFKANGCYVLEKDIRELTPADVERFKPNIIFGYDYSYMHNSDLCDYIVANKDKYKLVHYFADEPDGKFAYTNSPDFYEKYKSIKAYSFVWDREFCAQLPKSHYLPLAVNAKAYRVPEFNDSAYTYDISFVGRPLTEKRQNILCHLIKVFGQRLNIFCYEPHFLRSVDEICEKGLLNEKELDIYKNSYRGYLENEKEIARVYNSSKININITLQGETSLNYRVFEVLASRGFLITDDVSDVQENFSAGKDLEVYTGIDDLVDKIMFYLKNPSIAEKIVYNGFSAVTKRHSYTARANTILQSIKSSKEISY